MLIEELERRLFYNEVEYFYEIFYWVECEYTTIAIRRDTYSETKVDKLSESELVEATKSVN